MKRLSIFAIVMALAAPAATGAGAKTIIHGGFVSGKAYLDMPALRKIAYVTGLLDGIFLAPVFGGTVARQAWFGLCVDSLGPGESQPQGRPRRRRRRPQPACAPIVSGYSARLFGASCRGDPGYAPYLRG